MTTTVELRPAEITAMAIKSATRPPQSRWVVPGFLVLMMVGLAVVSDGFVEPYDEIVHFLYARMAWSNPQALLSIWARAGCTGYFALFAPLGLVAARLGAVLVTVAAGVGMTVVARHFLAARKSAEGEESWFARHGVSVAWVLLFAQPFFAIYSFTVMTEMLLGASWIWAMAVLVMAHRARWRGVILAGLVLGMGGLMRPEGWIAIACWPMFTWVWLRRPVSGAGAERLPLRKIFFPLAASSLLAATPTLGWYVFGLAVYQDPLWFVHTWPWSTISVYGRTGAMFFLAMGMSMAVWMWAPILVGIASLARRAKGKADRTWADSGRDGLLILASPVGSVFLLHGILGNLGLFGSLSLARYFIIIAPMAAILALLGLIACEGMLKGRGRVILRCAAIAIPIVTHLALVRVGYLPTWKNLATRRMDVAVAEVRRLVAPAEFEGRVIAGHPYMIFALGMRLDGRGDLRTLKITDLRDAAPGTLLVIENYLWVSGDRPTPEVLRMWGYREDEAVSREVDALYSPAGALKLDPEESRVRMWIKER